MSKPKPIRADERSNFTIRIEPELKDRLIEIARLQDRTASVILRDFIRQYVKKNEHLLSK